MYILSKLSTLVIAAAMSLGFISAPVQTVPLNLGAAVPQTPALYDGYLASNIGTTDTSMTITPSTLRNGKTLSGYMCFVIDVNQPTVEYACGTAAGSSITSLTRGVDILNPTTTSATLAFSHRRFASVSVSDYPTIQLLTQKLNGTDNLDSPLSYSFASTSLTRPGHLVDKDYVDALAFQGAGVINANTTAKGVVQVATTLQAASSTDSGSTGATLVIPSSSATSTYNSATAALRVVVTRNNGTIDPGFLTGVTVASSTTFTNGIQLLQIGKNLFWATTSQTWTVPSGITYADVQCVGAGGAGQGTTGIYQAGGGGGGGAYARMTVNLTGSSTVGIIIGVGGTAGTGNGAAGTATYFGGFFSALGGAGSDGTNQLGGAASSTISNLFISIPGGEGSRGTAASGATMAIGGAGGGSFFGSGGAAPAQASTNGQNGNQAQAFGGGGSGSAQANSASTFTGGNGKGGACIVTY